LGAAAGNKKKGGGGGGSIVEVKPEPEPEGGIDLPLTKGAADFRMKEMRELDPAEVEAKYSQSGGGSSDSGGGDDKPNPTHEFWMTGTIDTVGVERNKKSLLQEMKGKAAFPGFRKGQVPPYAMNQVVLFAIQDALINTVKVVIGEFGLNNGGEVTIHEDVEAISRAYKAGTNITFTATVQAAYANANEAAPKEAPEAAGDGPAAAEVLSTTEAEAAVESSE
jgi:Bacterial trigger factor protein (TF)